MTAHNQTLFSRQHTLGVSVNIGLANKLGKATDAPAGRRRAIPSCGYVLSRRLKRNPSELLLPRQAAEIRDLTSEFFGDPRPGYSQLDRGVWA